MESRGDETSYVLTCPRDGVETRLKCPDCRTPICPSCFVRTPVGLKCQTCAAPVPAAAGLSGRPRRTVLVAAAVALIVVAAGAWALFGRSDGSGSGDDGDLGISPATQDVVQGAMVGTGRAPDGRSWALHARRDDRGRICTQLNLTGGGNARETCDAAPGGRPFGPVRTRGAIQGNKVTFQSWGVVSERTVRVQTTSEDGTTTDAEVFGAEAGLGVKFFMSYVDRLGGVTFVAFGANGEELGRVDPPPIPPPPGR